MYALKDNPAIAWFRFWWQGMAILVSLGIVLRVVFALATGLFPQMTAAERITALVGGLRFDLAVAAALLLFTQIGVLCWRLLRFPAFRQGRGWLAPAVGVLYLCQMGDLLYALESGRHVSHEIIELWGSWENLRHDALASLLWFLPVVPCMLLVSGLPLPRARTFRRRGAWVSSSLVFLASVVCVRGGLFQLPLHPGEAWGLGRPVVAIAGLNGAYSVIHSAISAKKIRPPQIASIDPAERQQRLKDLYPEPPAASGGQVTPVNVVWLFLESWPAELMKSGGYPEEVTPFYDSLAGKSLTAAAMMAGGHRTVEGVFASLCSFVNPMGVSLASPQMLSLDYRCIPQILKDQGWSTAFLQGGHRNSAKLGILTQRLGVTIVNGKQDIKHSLRFEPNHWGVHDHDLYDHAMKMMDTMGEPYFIAINTTTTHDEILPAGITPAFGMESPLERKKSTMRFADQALAEFIARYEQTPRKLKTVFVVMADHTAHVNSSSANHYRIPFALYAPGIVTPAHLPVVISQRDAAPTLLSLLGMNQPSFAGKSLLDSHAIRFADYAHAGHIGWIEGPALVEFNAATADDLRCFEWNNDWLLKHPLSCDDKHREMQRRALAFHSYSNELVFSGRTTEFRPGSD